MPSQGNFYVLVAVNLFFVSEAQPVVRNAILQFVLRNDALPCSVVMVTNGGRSALLRTSAEFHTFIDLKSRFETKDDRLAHASGFLHFPYRDI
jgi:hypothetical protein